VCNNKVGGGYFTQFERKKMAHLGFNPANVEPPVPIGLLPKGRYIVACEKSEVKENKKGTGHILMLQFVIQEGEYKKKKIYDYINIKHNNHVAQRVGQQHLAGMCHALGITHLENSQQLHGLPLEVEIGIQEGKDGWESKNIIRGFVKKVADKSGVDLSAPMAPPPMPISIPPVTTPPTPSSTTLATMDDDIPF
jgi:hypothetical protein